MKINVEKATNKVVDADQMYDPRFFDNLDFPDGTIQLGDNPRKYMLVAGAIVKRPFAELVQEFADERQKSLIARIQSEGLAPTVKQILIDLIR